MSTQIIKKKKIAVIFTGGTIGSACEKGRVRLSNSAKYSLLERAQKKLGDGISFETYEPVNFHSENVTAQDLYKIVECIDKIDQDDCDGIVLTHGTDTLSFTANYLALVVDTKIPVVLVSALYPLSDARSNGVENFLTAVSFIEQTAFHGVFVANKNPSGECTVHLAGRILDAKQLTGEFESAGEPFGVVRAGEFVQLANLPLEKKTFGGYALSEETVVIHANALMDFSYFDFEKKRPKTVVIALYHSGTISMVGDNGNFLKFVEYCKKMDVLVVVAPIVSGANVYESVDFEGCVLSYDQSVEMTVVKVRLALGCNKKVEDVLNENYCLEKL